MYSTSRENDTNLMEAIVRLSFQPPAHVLMKTLIPYAATWS